MYWYRYEDQQKVRRAITTQYVDPADVPATTKVAVPPVMAPGPSSNAPTAQKRKYQPDVAGTSQSLGQSGVSNPNGAQGACELLGDEDDDVVPIEPEPVDELYCVTKTSIVGVQYYQGP